MQPLSRLLPLLTLIGALCAGETVTVFAAASLTAPLAELAKSYETRTGVRIVTSFAASSSLARQIEHGAPADIFCSADLTWMDYLAERTLIDGASRCDLLGNALVVIAPLGKPFTLRLDKDFPAEAAFTGRLAIGDPASVPVGVYAKEAFTNLGWWGWLEKRLAPTADARAALKLVESAEVDAGVVYATDAKASRAVTVIATVPATLHKPIRYPFAATAGAGPAARAVLAYIAGAEAQPIYERYGFTVLRR